ncbi:MAG: thiamine diphosphokinase [Clostridiales bacterium]|jgi:thiamine pyrophosphokinase|nr:thiamine diphosphokinase [Clostridiales bacterium]
MKAIIIAYGEAGDIEDLTEEISSTDYIICADGGGDFAYKNGIIPDYLIGDFDSIDQEILSFFMENGVDIIRYSKDKDYTDTEICVYKALELGCIEICIIAGIGSRIDHSLGNIGLLHIIAEKGAKGCIISKDSTIYLCRDNVQCHGKIGETVSIIPLLGNAKGLKSTGLKFELNNLNIEFGKPIGISNEMTDNKCSIEIENGEILVIKLNNI